MAQATFTATFTTAGTYTWVAMAGLSAASTACWGAGSGSSSNAASSGGGGGEYAAEPSNTVTAGNSYTVVAGTGGTAGVNGGNSAFSGTGTTTTTAHGGQAGVSGSVTGPGGTGSTNTVHHDGGTGAVASGTFGGGGGGAAGPSSAGNSGSGTTGGAAVVGGGAGGAGGANGNGGNGTAPGGGAGGNGTAGLPSNAVGAAGQAILTWQANSPAVLAAATTGGVYTWTAPAGITSVSWVITGTASFDGNSSSGNETVVPGTAYTISVGAGGSLTIAWGVSLDAPAILPGPTWLAQFKPGLGKRRPLVPPSGPYFGNLPNLTDVQAIEPGQVWLDHFKPGLPKPRPFLPAGSGITSMGSAQLQPYATSGTGSVTPGFTGGANLAPYKTSGSVGVPVVASGSAALGAYSGQGNVGVPVVASGSASLAPYAVHTPPFIRDFPHIAPGPVWIDHFKPGMPRPPLKVPGGPAMMGARGAAPLAPYGTNGQVIAYLPFPQFNLSLMYEMLVNGTWTDISAFVYQRNDQVITRGLPNETQNVTPSAMTLTLNNRDGRFSVLNSNGAYWPYLTRNVQVRCSIVNQASSDGVPYTGYRFWGELSSDPPSWDPTGADVYCQVTVAGPLQRYVQGAKLGSALRQYYSALTGSFAPYAAWPCEDGSQATQLASLLPSVAAMSITGKPSLASNSAFGGSDPIPAVAGSVWHGITGSAADPPGTGSITQKFPGTYTFTAPPGVTQVTGVTATGSGGGGGDTDGTTGGGGGGGGGSQTTASVAVTAGNSYTYVVAPGGAAGAGGTGFSGSPSSFTGDSATVTGGGGAGGSYAGAGGAGGSGQHHGGAGGSGEASSTFNGSGSVSGSGGATGGGTNTRAGNNSVFWTAPPNVGSTVSVTATAGGGGGGAGGGGQGGSKGGGAGAYVSDTVSVTASTTYTVFAGNGGNGGTGGGSLSGHGDPGGNSGMSGDGGSVIAGGGGGGTLGADGGDGEPVSGSGFNGGGGGFGTPNIHGGGGSGGGAGSASGSGATGANAAGDSGGANRIGGDGGSTGGPGLSGTEYGQTGAGGGGGGASNSNPATDKFYGGNGGGGAGGFTQWFWTQTGSPTGGGGGSSAGTTLNGSPGDSAGDGGSAPSGGGNGGNAGGSPAGNGPGGGGAGAVPAGTSGGTASPPGNGAAGQVTFSWSGGVTSPVAADIVRFLLEVDSAGAADGAVLLRILTYGTLAQVDVVYHTGGNLELIGYNSSSAQVFASASTSFGANGTPLYVSVELTGSGSSVNWKLTAVQPGATSLTATVSGSAAGSVGFVSDILADPAGTVTDSGTAIGWITAQTYADTLLNLSPIAAGYAGETVAARIARLCAAQGLAFTLVGNAADTPQMGPQQDDTFVNVLQSCADLDRGQVYETRAAFGIGYRTRKSMQGQSPSVIASYGAGTLAAALKPTADDQFTRNDITVTRNGGASSTATQKTGVMSVNTPPNGVGDYTYSLTVQAFADTQLAPLAAWMLTVGTVSQYRFPSVPFDMARSAVKDLFAAIPALDVGDFLQIPDPPVFLQNYPVNQLCWGFTETLNSRKWTIAVNTVPEDPFAGSGQPTW